MGGGKSADDEVPRTLNQSSAIRLLTAHGWTKERGGKHSTKMTKPGHRPITLPMHNRGDYSPWLRQSILRQAGLAGPHQDEGDER
jgi:predicted RNA binding protein YcfA (HicA-like mRNA interferase family)